MSLSFKHHYLPEFYLKGFTNDKGTFSIFDYKKGQLKKGEYAPSTHFFEPHRNTVEFKGAKSDLPETFYSIQDNRFAKVLQVIQSSKGVPNLDNFQMFAIQEFVSNIFWRLPKNDKLYKEEFKNNPLFTRSFKIVNKATGEVVNNDYSKEVRTSQALEMALRANASTLSFMLNNSTDLINWRISYITKGFHLCSDNPLIIRDNNVKDIFDSEFLFPLTKNHLLIRTYKTITKQTLTPEFSFMTDLTVFLQGKKYCASACRDFLNTINLTSKTFSADLLRYNLFRKLDEITNG